MTQRGADLARVQLVIILIDTDIIDIIVIIITIIIDTGIIIIQTTQMVTMRLVRGSSICLFNSNLETLIAFVGLFSSVCFETCFKKAGERFKHLFVQLQPGDALFFHSNLLHTSAQATIVTIILKSAMIFLSQLKITPKCLGKKPALAAL